jgi:TolB-like protein
MVHVKGGPQKEVNMRLKHVIILAAVILALIPLGSAAQQPLRVAVLPFTVHSDEDLSYLRNGIWDIISTRIIVEGEIETVDKPLVERFLPDVGDDVTDQGARWLGNRVGADYVVYGSITKVGEYISLDAKVVHVPGTRATASAFAQHKGMDEVMAKVSTFAQDISNRIVGRATSYDRRRPGELRQYLMFQAVGYSKLQNYPQQILKGVDVGDVDGDGNNEIVVMTHYQIWLYRDEGKTVKRVAEFTTPSNNTFLTLDVIDINGDDKAEICVTNAIEDTLQSFILAYEEGTFSYVATDLNWYLRVQKVPGQGEVLLAQRMGADRDYEGPMRLVQWKKDKAKIGKKIKTGKKGALPKGVEWVLAFAAGTFTAPETQESLVMEETGTVRLLDAGGATQWKSSEELGGSDNYIDRPDLYADRKGTAARLPRRIYLPHRMVAKDLDGDGIDDVVVVSNKFKVGGHVERTRPYDKGYVAGLVWDGMTLAQIWRTQDIPGYVADFQVKDVDNDGQDELVTVSVSSHILKSDAKSLLMVYELYE